MSYDLRGQGGTVARLKRQRWHFAAGAALLVAALLVWLMVSVILGAGSVPSYGAAASVPFPTATAAPIQPVAGTTVVAVCAGVVETATATSVEVRCGDRSMAHYSGLDTVSVAVASNVAEGQQLGGAQDGIITFSR